MSIQWLRRDHRLDVELAVALEHGWRIIVHARAPRQIDRAVAYNLRLWRIVRQMTQRCPNLNDRESLVDTADHVATLLLAESGPCPDSRDMSFIAGRNLSLARDMAGGAAADLARDALMAEWGRSSSERFETWLLTRLEQAGCPSE